MLTQENAHKEFEGWLNRCRAANIDIKAILQASGLRTDRGFHKADGAKPPKPVVFDTLQAFRQSLPPIVLTHDTEGACCKAL